MMVSSTAGSASPIKATPTTGQPASRSALSDSSRVVDGSQLPSARTRITGALPAGEQVEITAPCRVQAAPSRPPAPSATSTPIGLRARVSAVRGRSLPLRPLPTDGAMRAGCSKIPLRQRPGGRTGASHDLAVGLFLQPRLHRLPIPWRPAPAVRPAEKTVLPMPVSVPVTITAVMRVLPVVRRWPETPP